MEHLCKLCREDVDPATERDELVSPCACSGTMKFIHKKCFKELKTNYCCDCHFSFYAGDKVPVPNYLDDMDENDIQNAMDQLENATLRDQVMLTFQLTPDNYEDFYFTSKLTIPRIKTYFQTHYNTITDLYLMMRLAENIPTPPSPEDRKIFFRLDRKFKEYEQIPQDFMDVWEKFHFEPLKRFYLHHRQVLDEWFHRIQDGSYRYQLEWIKDTLWVDRKTPLPTILSQTLSRHFIQQYFTPFDLHVHLPFILTHIDSFGRKCFEEIEDEHWDAWTLMPHQKRTVNEFLNICPRTVMGVMELSRSMWKDGYRAECMMITPPFTVFWCFANYPVATGFGLFLAVGMVKFFSLLL